MPPQAEAAQWQTIMNLECATQKDIDITSYGDWGFSLRRIPLNALAQPLRDLVVKDRLQNHYYYYENTDDEEQEKPEVQVDEHPDVKDIQSALSIYVSVNVNETEDWFRNKYGFWEIEDFKVYDYDGNGCTISFQTKDHAYIGYYGTS